MKKIEAIIKPFKVDEVKDELNKIGVLGLTVSEVKGYGRQKGHTELYRGSEYEVDLLPKTKIEIAVPDDKADDIVDAITTAANSNKIGDGKIFVMDLNQLVRIRTGDLNEDAL